ncbi:MULTISPECIES: STAS domain-containing protein [unclassified Thermosipho (in: thermotogales)]|uniref:STAS domain-containing protein n=1 Tax=unclassified Thermosipho (in: thermotogales) TaxID=2676525 RepID=UPI00098421BE|nr:MULTISPECIES: STAS domain-containing protein [unclassified Thermosipho (in: thermotogales)]MBT1247828.1 anti-anti-sigma factor [Thermosipho sp. 1244]OOC45471.1 anti-sigma factor antagonist [Thermosipho sp. 1223]
MRNTKVEFLNEEKALIAKVYGDIDAYHSADIKKEIREKMISSDKEKIIIDLSEVNYIDSAGLGSLVAILKDARMNNKLLYLMSPKQSVMRVFEMTRLDKVFNIISSIEEI